MLKESIQLSDQKLDEILTELKELNKRQRLTLKPKEAAEELSISLPTLYDLCHTAGFPSVKVGKMWIIPRSRLEEWINEHAGEEIA